MQRKTMWQLQTSVSNAKPYLQQLERNQRHSSHIKKNNKQRDCNTDNDSIWLNNNF